MPPFEAKKMLSSEAAVGVWDWRDGRWQRKKLVLVDIKRAHLNGGGVRRGSVERYEGGCRG